MRQGFTHVSDDDYARTVIAEQFAHAPRLDPSGTSWLPAPFWVEGAAMMLAGRSLGVARAVAVVLGTASVAVPYAGMRSAGVSRPVAAVGVGVAMFLPWNAWLGVATVPDGWVGALVAGSVMAMGGARPRWWAGAGLVVGSLSRYEVWPACAVLAGLCLWRAARCRDRSRNVPWAMVVAAGPIAWMAWNAHAHGSALHFLSRVAAFRHAVGAADIPTIDKVFGYPRALVQDTPEAVALGLVGAVGMMMDAPMRARWRWPATVVLSIVMFLIWGDMHDGAPTHHPARALGAVWWILVGMGVDAIAAGERRAGRPWRTVAAWSTGAAALLWLTWLPSRWSASPGRGDSERRDAQIARGLDLRGRGVLAASIRPCSFEHFALIAAWGRPEGAEVAARTGEAPTSECPRVVER
jgi:hypothetical protein